MDAQEALAELMGLSSQLADVALVDGSGSLLASSSTPERGEHLARIAGELLVAAGDVRDSGDVTRVEITSGSRGLFVVAEGGRTAVATTVAEPTAGLVVYDLRTALRRLEEPPAPKRKRAPRKPKADA